MGKYKSFVERAIPNMLTTIPYGWKNEFVGKNMDSGTRMPLSKLAVELRVFVEKIAPYVDGMMHGYRSTVRCVPTEAGKRILERMERLGDKC